MDFVKLGDTGMKVSRICLGCMSYGKVKATPWPGMIKWDWTLSEENSRPFIKRAGAGHQFLRHGQRVLRRRE
jgi:aryl-alcohol dehydrogenase-like predicted oxidoreductase